jgi:DNA-binding LacI/PurR family transcriptional regulator
LARPTIRDIAQAAGVSNGSVSAALNNKPGVSPATRDSILKIADDLGWSPSHAARTLMNDRAEAIALVFSRPRSALSQGPFIMQFIEGVESVIAQRNYALMLHVVDSIDAEMDVYRRWWSQRRVDGVIISNRTIDDPRIEAVTALGIPAVWIGQSSASDGAGGVSGLEQALRYLTRLGHTTIARVAGDPALVPISERDKEFRELAIALDFQPTVVPTDFSGQAGAQATRALLTADQPPTAIIYDNDLMAVAGLSVAQELGVDVPGQLSLMSWDDSVLAEITNPALSAVRRNNAAFGALQAERLLRIIDGFDDPPEVGPFPVLVPRGSTGPAPGAR